MALSFLLAAAAAANPLAGLQACRAEPNAEARLACFERQADELQRGTDAGDFKIVTRNEVRSARRSLFGFTLPRIGLLGGSEGKEEITEITVSASRVQDLGYGKSRFSTAENGTWETTEAGATIVSGGAVNIRKASLGGYFIRPARGRAVRGRRVE